MNKHFTISRRTVQRVALATAIFASFGAAHAQTLYGGGATFPAAGYIGPSAALSGNRLTNPVIDTASLFGAYRDQTSVSVSYCQTGSGTGRKVLEGVSGYSASNTCNVATPTGFSGSATNPDFAASDAPLSQSDVTAVVSNKSVDPVQFPSLAGAVAIAYNNSGVSGTLALTDSQICGIYNGTISDWDQLDSSYASKTIKPVYRTDGSGTTFSFSNHLAAVCSLSSGHYTTSDTFSTVVSTASGIPANAIGASGNPGVVDAIGNNDGAIGYTEYSDASHRSPTLPVATVNGYDPTGLASYTPTVSAGEVITGVDSSNGKPTVGAVTGTSHGATCINLVDPNSYSNPSSGYPILLVTYLMSYYSGNANVTGVRGLLGAPYKASIKNVATDIGPGTGLVFLSSYNPTSTINGCVN